MDLTLSSDAPTSQRFGIEEEYFITDLLSRQMLSEPSIQVLRDCREAIGEGFAYEMIQGQIEVASPVFDNAHQARNYFSRVRCDLGSALSEHGLGFVCSGSHPMADWQSQRITEQPHFQELANEFEIVARRSVLSGLHVHAEIPPNIDRIAVMNEVLPWLPMLLAISVSSPLWQGRDSGYYSYRQVACDEWPWMGVPERLLDEPGFNQYLGLLKRTGALPLNGNVWWGCRPSLSYPTLELRMTDACPRLCDTLTLAGLFRVMVRYACLLEAPGAEYTLERHWLLKENRSQARRWGPHGCFMMTADLGLMSIEQWLTVAEQTFGATAHALGEGDLFNRTRLLLQEGTSAERQMRSFKEDPRPNCESVVDLLLEESMCCSKKRALGCF